ncbi:hypothetical protein ASG47_07190 [Devosia sp. Leaf420]|uniref:hypothetical protein n=1 Tax=Devosia sp. Leaf420 TaxID=1736374 RepID=UPI000715DE90|nr:hypothetical protein [Devosia sp. Leaf420]KQT48151.1 hypothetical protein ASG47_07190 [Devosia sp. Leaf420]
MARTEAEKNWIDVARKGLERLAASVEHGRTMSDRAVVAKDLGVSRQTLRNYIDCYRFVSEVETFQPEAADALRTYSATVVAIYSRWAKYDRPGAMEHAIAGQGLPAAAIIAAEKSARRAIRPTNVTMLDGSMDGARGSAGPSVASALKQAKHASLNLESFSVKANSAPLSLAMGVTQVLASEEGTTLAVLELDRGSVGDGHRRNARTVLAKASLAAAVHPLVIILLPDAVALSEFRAMLPPAADFQRVSPLPAFVFAEGLGWIIAMTAERFSQDWASA